MLPVNKTETKPSHVSGSNLNTDRGSHRLKANLHYSILFNGCLLKIMHADWHRLSAQATLAQRRHPLSNACRVGRTCILTEVEVRCMHEIKCVAGEATHRAILVASATLCCASSLHRVVCVRSVGHTYVCSLHGLLVLQVCAFDVTDRS